MTAIIIEEKTNPKIAVKIQMSPIKLISCAIIISSSCNPNLKDPVQPDKTADQKHLQSSDVPDTDPTSFVTYCHSCHNPAALSHDDIIAPPLAAVKRRYTMTYRTRDEFVKKMTSFLLDPNTEDAIMFGAVKKFGLMAKIPADEKTIQEIVEYLYDKKPAEPAWYSTQMTQGRE